LRKWTILCVSAVAWLAPSAVAPGLPALYADYAHLPNAEILARLVLTLPMLFIALSGPVVGYAVDRFGRRPVLIFSMLGYSISGLSGIVLESLTAILVGRAFLGVFLAGILTSVTALIGDYYKGTERRKIVGLQGTFMSLGTVVFVVLGGLLAEIHWRVAFALFSYALLILPAMLLSLHEPLSDSKQLAGKVARQPLTGEPRRIILSLYILAFVCMIALFMIPSQTQFFLREIDILDPTRAGIAVGTFNLSSGLASLAFPWLHRRFGTLIVFALMFSTVAIGYILVGLSNNYLEVVVAMAIGGLSMGVFLPNANLAIISNAPEGVRGRALGGLTTSYYLGQFLSPFYSVPIGISFGIGTAFVVTGFWLFSIAAMFALLAACRRLAES